MIQKTADATVDLINNKIANKIANVSKISETVVNKHDTEISKERYISERETENCQ